MAVERELERHQDSPNGDGRRRPLDYEELDGLLAEADRSMKDGDLRAVNEVLKRASVKAASMWGGVGVPALPAHAAALIGLLSEVQRDINDPEKDHEEMLRTELRELRNRFGIESRRDEAR